MSKALKGTIVFTVIEVIILTAWLMTFENHPAISAAILLGGLFVEHYVSVNVGAGRPLFGSLPPDRG